MTIMCASWNVNAKPPPEGETLKTWLLPDNTTPPDIYAIGLQEIVDLNVMNIVVKSAPSTETAAVWVTRISKVLNELSEYKILLDKTMVGILSVVFVKGSLHRCITDVKYACTPTGSYGVTGNKGGIAISMKIHDSPVCFVCAHFHANRDAVAARNLDYQSICDNTEFVSVGPAAAQDNDTLFIFPNASDTNNRNKNADGTASNGSSGSSTASSSNNNSSANSPLRSRASATAGALAAGAMAVAAAATGGNSNSNSSYIQNPASANGKGSSGKSSSITAANFLGVTGTSTTTNPIALAKKAAAASAAAASNSSGDNTGSNGDASTTPAASTTAPVQHPTRVLEHEYVFWVGDLNYRIDEDIEILEIFERLYNETWEVMRASDQLHQERAKQNVFHGFKEGTLSFPPTYKYQPGTDVYDTRPDKKLRAPAWCDRILWRSARADRDVTMLHYGPAPLHMSDHKPVSALFNCNTHKIVKDKLKSVYADLLVTVDKWVNESKPKIEIDNRLINFGPIAYNVS